jgi:hypothetical protein
MRSLPSVERAINIVFGFILFALLCAYIWWGLLLFS